MQAQTFIFFGIFGSGKGTQVKLLTDFIKSKSNQEVIYAGTGEGLRNLLKLNNYASNLAKDFMARGKLIPDFLVTSLITNTLVSSLTAEKHLFFDGYPRTVVQSEIFENIMKFFKRGQIKIIYIELSKEEGVKRNLLRGRHDDTEESFSKRYEEHVNKELPAMNYFKGKTGYTIYTINGEQTIENVHKDIIRALNF